VKNLRRKLETGSSDPPIIETVLSAGYRLGLSRD
jgi:DNA-binding response OmpR family regulator